MPAIPPVAKPNEFSSIRKSLPIYELREQILKLISENQVIKINNYNRVEEGVRVCSDVVLICVIFWHGFAGIFILACSIVVLQN